MDSGVAESVALTDMAPWVPESTGSRRGQTYMSAFGEKFPNMGEKQMKVWTNEGKPAMATFPMCRRHEVSVIESPLKAEKLIRPIYTSTFDGVERVTDGNTDKAGIAEDVEQVDGDELGEALDPLRRRVCRQPTPTEIRKPRVCCRSCE